MTPSFEKLQNVLKRLPGLGTRSAERIALRLVVENPEESHQLVNALNEAVTKLRRCAVTGNLCETDVCEIYANPSRNKSIVCVVERVPDLLAIERSSAFNGNYHVLHGKLSPLQGVGPEQLNFEALENRIQSGEIEELILALGNDIEGEATCHYIQDVFLANYPDVKVTRIGFGLPSGSGVTFADSATLKSALDRRTPLT